MSDGAALLEALEFESRYKLSFWYALIVQAANAAGAEFLCSEGFDHGQVYGVVTEVNPFRWSVEDELSVEVASGGRLELGVISRFKEERGATENRSLRVCLVGLREPATRRA